MIRWKPQDHTSEIFEETSRWHFGYVGKEWRFTYFKDEDEGVPSQRLFLLVRQGDRPCPDRPLGDCTWLASRPTEEGIREFAAGLLSDLEKLAAVGGKGA